MTNTDKTTIETLANKVVGIIKEIPEMCNFLTTDGKDQENLEDMQAFRWLLFSKHSQAEWEALAMSSPREVYEAARSKRIQIATEDKETIAREHVRSVLMQYPATREALLFFQGKGPAPESRIDYEVVYWLTNVVWNDTPENKELWQKLTTYRVDELYQYAFYHIARSYALTWDTVNDRVLKAKCNNYTTNTLNRIKTAIQTHLKRPVSVREVFGDKVNFDKNYRDVLIKLAGKTVSSQRMYHRVFDMCCWFANTDQPFTYAKELFRSRESRYLSKSGVTPRKDSKNKPIMVTTMPIIPVTEPLEKLEALVVEEEPVKLKTEKKDATPRIVKGIKAFFRTLFS